MSKNEFDSESMLDIYIFETMQLIGELENSILEVERGERYTENFVNEIFRRMHTIKGSSGMMGFDNISALAHTMEDVFSFLRENLPGNIDYESLSELILNCIDCIKAEIDKLKNNHSPDGEFSELMNRIEDYLKRVKAHFDEQDCLPQISAEISNDESYTLSENINASAGQDRISVSVCKLDKLLDLVGELLIAQAAVKENSDIKETDSFNKSFGRLEKVTHEIQDMVMSVRMVPLSKIFQKMHRLVRDMSKRLNKDVKLEFIGEDTEVDKNIIEHISDPLMHLIRNAVDHGLESCLERVQAGKEQTGTIVLEAENCGNDVLIHVRDDGRGIDTEKIFEKAREAGVLEKEREEINEKELLKYIFLPGFSTAEKVSEYSGRGVGMDAVAKEVEKIGGAVQVSSIKGSGTEIVLRIPLTIAMMNGMNIRAGKYYFTIPTISIKEFFSSDQKEIITDSQFCEFIMIRGKYYTVFRLEDIYHKRVSHDKSERKTVIMVENDDRVFCVLADEVIGQQEMVVKPLPKYIERMKKVRGVTGCTLLGNGSISLILDISGVL